MTYVGDLMTYVGYLIKYVGYYMLRTKSVFLRWIKLSS